MFDYKNCVIEKVLREENYLSRLYIIKRCRLVGGRREDILMGLEKDD